MELVQSLILIGIFIIVIYFAKKHFSGGIYLGTRPNLDGYIAIVTGGGSGIGRQTVRSLAHQGCRVVFGDIVPSQNIADQINNELGKNLVQYYYLDLGDLQSIRTFSKQIKLSKIDFLVNNAGVMGLKSLVLTKNNHQAHFGINYIGHFYLTHLLWKKLNNSSFFRIANISSITHRRWMGFGRATTLDINNFNFQKINYDSSVAYSRSKLYLTMFSKALDSIIPKQKGFAVSVHPGIVRTNITRHMFVGINGFFMKIFHPIYWLFTKNLSQGVQTLLYVLYSEPNLIKGGQFYMDCSVSWMSPLVSEHWKKLFEKTEEILGIKFGDSQQN